MKNCIINNNDKDYEIAKRDIINEVKCQNVTFFCGAGFSKKSGLPLSYDIIKILAKYLILALDKINIASENEKDEIRKIVLSTRLEKILDAIVRFFGNSGLQFIFKFDSAIPNENHIFLANLVNKALIKNIITLNFDVLIENSILERNKGFKWCLPLANYAENIGNNEDTILIIKPHGTIPIKSQKYSNNFLAANLQYSGDRPQNETIVAIEQAYSNSKCILISGYSDDDWDIYPILISQKWEKIYWIEYNEITKAQVQLPNEKVINWLKNNNSWIISGDITYLLKDINQDLNLIDENTYKKYYNNKVLELIEKDISSIINNNIYSSVLAIISLADGRNSALYGKLIKRFENIDRNEYDIKLYEKWKKMEAWYYHAHMHRPQEAIKLYKEVISLNRIEAKDNLLDILYDCKTMFYEYISTLKRPYKNSNIIKNLIMVKLWKSKFEKYYKIALQQKSDNWERKEAIKQKALVSIYIGDLYHNWGYHLLIFGNRVVKLVTRSIFRKIAGYYEKTLKRYVIIDWEYHFARKIEAKLIAGIKINNNEIEKIEQILEMLEDTSQDGCQVYTRMIKSIINNDYQEYFSLKNLMLNTEKVATPTGIIRSTLLERYFWPYKVSFKQAKKIVFK